MAWMLHALADVDSPADLAGVGWLRKSCGRALSADRLLGHG